jgi:hypothetical protein
MNIYMHTYIYKHIYVYIYLCIYTKYIYIYIYIYSFRNVLSPWGSKSQKKVPVNPKKQSVNKGTDRKSKLKDIEATLELQKTRFIR